MPSRPGGAAKNKKQQIRMGGHAYPYACTDNVAAGHREPAAVHLKAAPQQSNANFRSVIDTAADFKPGGIGFCRACEHALSGA
jgi:hypothetical protein